MPRAAIPGSGSLVPLEYQESLGSGLHAEHGAMNEHASPGCCDAVMMPFLLSVPRCDESMRETLQCLGAESHSSFVILYQGVHPRLAQFCIFGWSMWYLSICIVQDAAVPVGVLDAAGHIASGVHDVPPLGQ